MKAKFIVCSFFLLFINYNSEAQLLKKLTKRIQEKTEDVIVEKTADKVADKTSESLDKVFDFNLLEKGVGK